MSSNSSAEKKTSVKSGKDGLVERRIENLMQKRYSRPGLQESDKSSSDQPACLLDIETNNSIKNNNLGDAKIIRKVRQGQSRINDAMQQTRRRVSEPPYLTRYRPFTYSSSDDDDDEEDDDDTAPGAIHVDGPRPSQTAEDSTTSVLDYSHTTNDVEQQDSEERQEAESQQVTILGYLVAGRRNRQRNGSSQELIEGTRVERTQDIYKRTILFGLLVVLLLVATAVTLSLVFLVFKEEEQPEEPPVESDYNSSQTSLSTDNPSFSPTVIPSLAPTTDIPSVSPSDSLAPTSDRLVTILDEVRRQFQTLTLEQDLMSRSSPQYKAALWMAEEDIIMTRDFDSPLSDSDSIEEFRQRYALAVFYYSTDGDEWSDKCNFLNVRADVCDWNCRYPIETDPRVAKYVEDGLVYSDVMGIVCNDAYGVALIIMDMAVNNLSGTLPEELQGLEYLAALLLPGNNLEGTIPFMSFEKTYVAQELGVITISLLVLVDNNLSGTIPEEIDSLTNLYALLMTRNSLTGTIPPSMGEMQFLALGLSHNLLSGTVPGDLFQNSNLLTLSLSYNTLSGTLPDDISLPSLLLMHMNENMISGTIPDAIGQSRNMSDMVLSGNMLTGTILPSSFTMLTNLEFLELYNNQLTGEALNWSIIGKMKNLRRIDLGDNKISGTIPREIGALAMLEILDLGHTNDTTTGTSSSTMNGGLPTELGNLQMLRVLSISRNDLGGTVPTEFGNLSSLYQLSLDNNPLTGTIPSELNKLQNLGAFAFQQTELGGDLDVICENVLNADAVTWLDGFVPVDGLIADCLEVEKITCCCCTKCCDNNGYCDDENVDSFCSFLV